MKKVQLLLFFISILGGIHAQQAVPLGKGSYAEFPPDAAAYEDGYFAPPYKWFELAWDELNLHDHAKNRPLPTNKWWSDFLFRGLGRTQPEFHKPPITVTTSGNRFGTEAWAYPQMMTASNSGFDLYYPQGFSGGGMVKGAPLRINAATYLQEVDENIVFADFENSSWPAGWKVLNNTKNISGPMAESEITQTPKPTGFQGSWFVNTFLGDDARLTLISPEFTVEKKYIRLLVGGGNHPDQTYVGLFVDGVKVLEEVGQNSGNLTQRTWDVTAYIGLKAEIRIVDNSGGGWGFIMCDEIVFTDNMSGGSGYTADFQTEVALVYDWSDLGFTLRSEMNEYAVTSTLIHGVPFAYYLFENLYPVVSPSGSGTKYYNVSGELMTQFPTTVDAFVIESDNRNFGVHLPAGAVVHRSNGGDLQIEFSGSNHYFVVSVLPDRSFLEQYDLYARNMPGDTRFEFEHRVESGKMLTTFNLDTRNLDNNELGGETLMSFLPHHYRTTEKSFNFIPGADYRIFLGQMHTAAGSSFEMAYSFGGMPPYLPEPLDLEPERKSMLVNLLEDATNRYFVNGNTYAKGLGEHSLLMQMARSMDVPAYKNLQNKLKDEFADWFTFSPDEGTKKERYFAEYPKYGALVGFSPGYGSQGFNDLHFHNGYFTIGAARLMQFDDAFKQDFAAMTSMVTRTFANWERYGKDGDVYMPYLRTFDPYLGHSFAGGTGDGGGNNQESSSEAINSWFGLYLLGLELIDKRMIETGLMGYLLESTATGEYWLDLYGDNFPPTYNHDYVGIKRTDNLAWATYFAGDPAWVLGIQACPSDFFFTAFGEMPEQMRQVQTSMFHDRTTFIYDGMLMHTNADPYDNIKSMGPYLGGYHLNIMNYYDPVHVADWIDDFCRIEGAQGAEWRNHTNAVTNYYLSHAMRTYGTPAKGWRTSIPSGAVYENHLGEITYLLYNPSKERISVTIYKENEAVDVVEVGAKQYYNSRVADGYSPSVQIENMKEGGKMALNKKVKLTAAASDKDGEVVRVDYFLDGEFVGRGYKEPFEVFIKPSSAGIKQLSAIATDNEGKSSEPHTITIEVLSIEQTPFNGSLWQVPGDKILAVQFDEGGPGISCQDREIEMQGGNNYRPGTGVETENSNNGDGNIGYTNPGEWYEYTINVEQAGLYELISRFSSVGGGVLSFDFNWAALTGKIDITSTGSWGIYIDSTLTVIPLKQGKQIMRVNIENGGVNLSSYRLVYQGEADFTSVEKSQTRVYVSPNPFRDFIVLDTDESAGFHSVCVYALDGTPVIHKTLMTANYILDTSTLHAGYYLLQLISKDRIITKKVIKF